MDPKTNQFRITVDARIGDKFTAVITSFYELDKVSEIELEGFGDCGKDACNRFIAKTITGLYFLHTTKGTTSLSWEGANLKIMTTSSGKNRHVTSTHYFPADLMVKALKELVDMLE